MALAAAGVNVILFVSPPFLPIVETMRRAAPSDVRVFQLPHPFGTAAPGILDDVAAAVVRAHADELRTLFGQ